MRMCVHGMAVKLFNIYTVGERLNQESKNVEECDLLRYASCKAKVLLNGVACDCGTSSSWFRGSVCVRIAYKVFYLFCYYNAHNMNRVTKELKKLVENNQSIE